MPTFKYMAFFLSFFLSSSSSSLFLFYFCSDGAVEKCIKSSSVGNVLVWALPHHFITDSRVPPERCWQLKILWANFIVLLLILQKSLCMKRAWGLCLWRAYSKCICEFYAKTFDWYGRVNLKSVTPLSVPCFGTFSPNKSLGLDQYFGLGTLASGPYGQHKS